MVLNTSQAETILLCFFVILMALTFWFQAAKVKWLCDIRNSAAALSLNKFMNKAENCR